MNDKTKTIAIAGALGFGLLVVVALWINSPSERESQLQAEAKQPSELLKQAERATAESSSTLADSRQTDLVRYTGIHREVVKRVFREFDMGGVRHAFSGVGKQEDMELLMDKTHGILLGLSGPDNDLTLVMIAAPTELLLREDASGKLDPLCADAFGCCIQQLCQTVDPSWVGELNKWVKDHFGPALISRSGFTTQPRRRLIAKLEVQDEMLCLYIGVPGQLLPTSAATPQGQ